MNRWECTALDCKVTATGVGGAVGLRAVGWYFEIGHPLKCPFHHPFKAGLVKFHDCKVDLCSICHASLQAEILQTVINSLKVREM